MLTRIYDTYLKIYIRLNDSVDFEQTFTTDWKLKEALGWMYDTYLIDDDKVVEQTCSYVKIYKLKRDGNN